MKGGKIAMTNNRVRALLEVKGFSYLAMVTSHLTWPEIEALASGKTRSLPCRVCGMPRANGWCSDPNCSTNPELRRQNFPNQVF